MKRPVVSILTHLTLFLALLALAPRAVEASDHADPMILEDPDANITGLFFFPKGDQMILILNVRRALGLKRTRSASEPTAIVPLRGNRPNSLAAVVEAEHSQMNLPS